MREIKFRAWDKNKKEMMTPAYLNPARTKLDLLNVPMWWNSENDETIWMQYTGLHDKNGKEIYEGDIVIIPGAKRAMQVVFQPPSFVMKIKPTHKLWSEFVLGPDNNQLQKVIGDIYENPGVLNQNAPCSDCDGRGFNYSDPDGKQLVCHTCEGKEP